MRRKSACSTISLCHLIKRSRPRLWSRLSGHLAPVDNSPIEVIRRLARNDEIAVASRSDPIHASDRGRLDRDRRDKSQQHLLAISGRSELEDR